MKSKRKRVARKNSDSGVSVGSSVGLNNSENSLDKDASFSKIAVNQLNWNLEPVVKLQDISLVQDVNSDYNISAWNMKTKVESEPIMEPFDFSKITITTSKQGRTVNGQLLFVPPVEPQVDTCIVLSSEDESDGDDYKPPEIDRKFCFDWNRSNVSYNLLEITSHNNVFKEAVLMEPNESDSFRFESGRSSSRCSTISSLEDHVPISPVLPRRTVFINQKQISSLEESKVVSPIMWEQKCDTEENTLNDSPIMEPKVTQFRLKRQAESPPESTFENLSGLPQENPKELFRTPSQQRLKRLRLELKSNVENPQSKKSPLHLSETPSTSEVSPNFQQPELRRPVNQVVKVLNSTVVSEPSKKNFLSSFKIPRWKKPRNSPPRFPDNSQIEDDAISIFASPELKSDVENDLDVTPIPMASLLKSPQEQNSTNVLNSTPMQRHSPIHLTSRWSPPPNLSPEPMFDNIPRKSPVYPPLPPFFPKDFCITQPPPPIHLNNFNNPPPAPPIVKQHNFNSMNTNQGLNRAEHTEKVLRNNKSQIIQMVHRLCRSMNNCKNNFCKYSHEIPEHFEQVLFASEIDCVNNVTKYVVAYCDASVINIIIPMVINFYSLKQDTNGILNAMSLLLRKQHLNINKKIYLQTMINAILSINETYTFKDVIDEILLYIGIKGSGTLDTLLEILPEYDGFLKKYWNQIWKMIKYRKTPVPFQVVDSFIQECINLDPCNEDNRECYQQLCKFLVHTTFEVKEVNKQKVQTLLIKMKNMNLDNCISSIRDIYNKAGCPLNDISNASNDNLLEIACDIPSEKIRELQRFLLDKNVNEIAYIIREYSHIPRDIFKVFSLVYTSKALTASEFIMLFQDVVALLDYPRAEGHLKVTIETIGFNLIPLYDFEKDYNNACIILNMFITNIKSFLSVKNYVNIDPYKQNLKNDPEKIVLFIKILTRGSFLNEAFTLIKMPEFDLFNKRTVKSLYNYKMDIIQRFISRTIATDLKLCWRILEYLVKNNGEVAKSCRFTEHYNSYLKQHLQSVDAEGVANEYYTSIKFYYEYINLDVLRAIVANLSTILQPIDLVVIYDYCCSKSIYFLHTGSETTITLRQNLTVPEIKMVFNMFFLKMLELNIPPVELKIRLTEANTMESSKQLGIFRHPEKCDNFAMMLRLSSALFTFQPPINIDDHPEKLPMDVVQRCLEHVRRNL